MMSVADDHDVRIDDESDPDVYRPVSRLAVAAVVLGCLSPLAFCGPAFWILPVIGGLLAGLALSGLSEPGTALIGRAAAVTGLALSIAVGAAGACFWTVSGQLVEARAADVARQWAQSIRAGRLLEARAMLLPISRPSAAMTVSTDEDVPSVPIDDPDADARAFREVPAVAGILACGERAALSARFDRHIPETQEQNEDRLVELRLGPCDGGSDVALTLHVKREFHADKRAWLGWAEQWWITAIEERK